MLGIKDKAVLRMIIDDADFNLLAGTTSEFYIIEAANMLVPAGHLTFTDVDRSLVNNLDRLMSALITFRVGYPSEFGTENLNDFNHVLFSLKDSDIYSSMDVSTMKISMDTWDFLGPSLTTGNRVMSYGRDTTDKIIEKFAEDRNIELGTIEPSSDIRSYLQAGWSDATFLRHLSKMAISNEYKTQGYVCFLDRDRKLTFSSVKYLFEKGKENPVNLIFTNNPNLVDKPNAIISWCIRSNGKFYEYRSGVNRKYAYFDKDLLKFTEETQRFDDNIKNLATSNYTGVSTGESDFTNLIDVGLKNSTISYQNKFQSSMLSFDCLVRYDENIKLGSVILVEIPSGEASLSPQSNIIMDSISSYWIVSRITHYVDNTSSNYFLKLSLVRSGIGSNESVGLVKGTAK